MGCLTKVVHLNGGDYISFDNVAIHVFYIFLGDELINPGEGLRIVWGQPLFKIFSHALIPKSYSIIITCDVKNVGWVEYFRVWSC